MTTTSHSRGGRYFETSREALFTMSLNIVALVWIWVEACSLELWLFFYSSGNNPSSAALLPAHPVLFSSIRFYSFFLLVGEVTPEVDFVALRK